MAGLGPSLLDLDITLAYNRLARALTQRRKPWQIIPSTLRRCATGRRLESDEPMLIDAHAHIDRYDLAGEGALYGALAEIAALRILTIASSMDGASYRRSLEIAADCSLILPLFGVHPWNAPQYAGRLAEMDELIAHSPMLGEIGLDYYFVRDPGEYPAQQIVLDYTLAAADRQQKIVYLHTKGAEADVLERLDRYHLPAVVVHWYSGPLDLFHDLAARDAYFTVGLEVCHSEHIRAIARAIPAGRLLTETDNPGGPMSFLGRPGTPSLIRDVVEGLAVARETTPEAIIQTVEANLASLFERDARLAGTWSQLLDAAGARS